MTQTELATVAGIAERRLRDALKQLEAVYLLRITKVRKARSETARITKIILLEPGSGIELNVLGDYHLEQASKIPVHDRYKCLLSDLDPKDKLKDIHYGVSGYSVCCPFCRSKRGPTFRFNSTEEDDHWKCFNCRRSGRSDYLWARLCNWSEILDWRKIMADCGVVAPLAQDPLLEPAVQFISATVEEINQLVDDGAYH